MWGGYQSLLVSRMQQSVCGLELRSLVQCVSTITIDRHSYCRQTPLTRLAHKVRRLFSNVSLETTVTLTLCLPHCHMHCWRCWSTGRRWASRASTSSMNTATLTQQRAGEQKSRFSQLEVRLQLGWTSNHGWGQITCRIQFIPVSPVSLDN